MVSLSTRLYPVFHLGGGVITARKKTNSLLAHLSVEYPEFMPLSYDACFFGPISSEAEKALDYVTRVGMVDEYFFVKRREPIHKIRALNEKGKYLANKILDDPIVLESMGLQKKKIAELSAKILFFALLPTCFTIAHTLYLDRIKKEKNLMRKSEKEKKPLVYSFNKKIETDCFEKLLGIYADYWRDLVKFGERERVDHSFAFPFAIKHNRIEERYDYLAPKLSKGSGSITAYLEEAENSKDRKTQKEFLMKLAQNNYSGFGEKVSENVRRLASDYPGIEELFVEEVISRLKDLKKHYHRIYNEGYQHIFEDFLAKMAKMTLDYLDKRDLKDRVHARVRLYKNRTVFKTHVPDEIKDKFRKDPWKWNYGLEYHMGHFPQIEPASYLVNANKEEYVRMAGFARTS